jgi:anti-sigma factor ChrR (cupin superfamily)
MSLFPPQLVLNDARSWAGLDWQAFREGVEAVWLYRGGEGDPASALLRYQPGAGVPRHRHVGWEHIVILAGSQRDETATYRVGDIIANRPGSEHAVQSDDGCVALLVWEKPPQFVGSA